MCSVWTQIMRSVGKRVRAESSDGKEPCPGKSESAVCVSKGVSLSNSFPASLLKMHMAEGLTLIVRPRRPGRGRGALPIRAGRGHRGTSLHRVETAASRGDAAAPLPRTARCRGRPGLHSPLFFILPVFVSHEDTVLRQHKGRSPPLGTPQT